MRRKADRFNPQWTIVVILSVSLMSTYCSDGVRNDIGRLLDARAQALSERDLSRYMSCISRNYDDGGKDYEFVKRNVSGYFSALDGVDIRFAKRKIYPDIGGATVYQDITMRVKGGGKNHAVLRGREKLRLVRERDGWKIVSGLFGSPPAAGARRGFSTDGMQETRGGADE